MICKNMTKLNFVLLSRSVCYVAMHIWGAPSTGSNASAPRSRGALVWGKIGKVTYKRKCLNNSKTFKIFKENNRIASSNKANM